MENATDTIWLNAKPQLISIIYTHLSVHMKSSYMYACAHSCPHLRLRTRVHIFRVRVCTRVCTYVSVPFTHHRFLIYV